MHKHICFFILVVLMIFFLGCTGKEPDKQFEDNKVNSKNKESENMISRWQAPPFEGKGELKLAWTQNISSIRDMMATPDCWYLEKYEDAPRGSTNRYGIDPQTGEDKYPIPYELSPENEKIEFETNPYDAVLGKTYGQYVYADNVEEEASSGTCWRLSDGKVLWRSKNVNCARYFEIVGGNLLFIDIINAGDNHISILNKDTGEELKTLKIEKARYDSLVKDGFLWIVNDKGQLMKINPNTLEYQSLKIPSEILCFLGYYKDYLLLYSETNIFVYNTKTEKVIQTISYKDLIMSIGIQLFDCRLSNGFFYTVTENDNQDKTYNIYKYQDDKFILHKTIYDSKYIYIVNNQWIMVKSDIINGFDPETLQTKWSIDLKKNNIDSGIALWLDWRGVLVVSDDAISCYAPPK